MIGIIHWSAGSDGVWILTDLQCNTLVAMEAVMFGKDGLTERSGQPYETSLFKAPFLLSGPTESLPPKNLMRKLLWIM